MIVVTNIYTSHIHSLSSSLSSSTFCASNTSDSVPVNAWTINESYHPKKICVDVRQSQKLHRTCFGPTPGLISYVGVTGRWGLLPHAHNACINTPISQHSGCFLFPLWFSKVVISNERGSICTADTSLVLGAKVRVPGVYCMRRRL